MRKLVHVFNAVFTIPFGVGAYILPRDMFAPFGYALDQTGVLLTKGYASAALGYGLVFWFTRNLSESGASRGLMLASLAFNAMEAAVQLPLAIHGLAKAPIWVTAGSHTLLVLLSLWALLRPGR